MTNVTRPNPVPIASPMQWVPGFLFLGEHSVSQLSRLRMRGTVLLRRHIHDAVFLHKPNNELVVTLRTVTEASSLVLRYLNRIPESTGAWEYNLCIGPYSYLQFLALVATDDIADLPILISAHTPMCNSCTYSYINVKLCLHMERGFLWGMDVDFTIQNEMFLK